MQYNSNRGMPRYPPVPKCVEKKGNNIQHLCPGIYANYSRLHHMMQEFVLLLLLLICFLGIMDIHAPARNRTRVLLHRST